jgi:hypothetical protein
MAAEEYPAPVLLLNVKNDHIIFPIPTITKSSIYNDLFSQKVVRTIFYKRNTKSTILHTIGPISHISFLANVAVLKLKMARLFFKNSKRIVDTEQICPKSCSILSNETYKSYWTAYWVMRHTSAFLETLACFIRWRMYIEFLALFEYGCKVTRDNDTLRNLEEQNELIITASEVHNT